MDLTLVLTILGHIFLILGALIFATAALGLIRFTDAYMRISAVGTAGGLGIIMVILGTLLLQPTVADTLKVILIILMQLGTSAIGTMVIARSAYLTGVSMNPGYFDELAEDGDGPDPYGRDQLYSVAGRDQQPVENPGRAGKHSG